jgi:RHS repeat-associated protein
LGQVTEYIYDELGNLIETRDAAGSTRWRRDRHGQPFLHTDTRYEYDALGRRTCKRDDFGTTEFLWDGLRLLQERRSRKVTTYVYQPGSHEPIARIDDEDEDFRIPGKSARIYHFHNHINGAPEELTNEAGEIVWQGRYKSWGRLALQRVAEDFLPDPGREKVISPQPLRMQGQYMEVETGLCYNTFRYYDPDIGRFISEDPIGLMGGTNLYSFAPNTDAWVDPWGWAGKKLNPNDINFSQRTMSDNSDYVKDMKNNNWDWEKGKNGSGPSAPRVMNIEGQWVTYDNRRVAAAQEAGLKKIPVQVVHRDDINPESSKGKTWWQSFMRRFRDTRNKVTGGIVPKTGLKQRPLISGKNC